MQPCKYCVKDRRVWVVHSVTFRGEADVLGVFGIEDEAWKYLRHNQDQYPHAFFRVEERHVVIEAERWMPEAAP